MVAASSVQSWPNRASAVRAYCHSTGPASGTVRLPAIRTPSTPRSAKPRSTHRWSGRTAESPGCVADPFALSAATAASTAVSRRSNSVSLCNMWR